MRIRISWLLWFIFAKNTIDKNYLPDAKSHGCKVFAQWNVTRIEMISKDENDYVNGCPCTNILLNIENPSLFFVFVLYIFIYFWCECNLIIYCFNVYFFDIKWICCA